VLLTPPLFHPNFGGVLVASDAHVVVSPSRSLKLFGREIILKYSNLCDKNIPQHHGRTDRRTDGRTTYCDITALCVASRGKNVCHRYCSCYSFRSCHPLLSVRYIDMRFVGKYLNAGNIMLTCLIFRRLLRSSSVDFECVGEAESNDS